MNTRVLEVLRLTLPELDLRELVLLWQNFKSLRRYYVGLKMKLGVGSLVVPAEDFFQKICDEDWDLNTIYVDEFVLAWSFMVRDLIEEAVHIAKNFPILNTGDLLALALTNGRLAALQILPPTQERLDNIWTAGFYNSHVSTELYDAYNLWGEIVPVAGELLEDQMQQLDAWTHACTAICLFLIDVYGQRCELTLDWVANKVYNYFEKNRATYGGRIEIMSHAVILRQAAAAWGYAPAKALVEFIANQ